MAELYKNKKYLRNNTWYITFCDRLNFVKKLFLQKYFSNGCIKLMLFIKIENILKIIPDVVLFIIR